MWIILLGILAVGALLYFLLHDSPADRLRKAEAAIQSGNYPAATEQINWLLENKHPSGAATLARLHLSKAQKVLQQGVTSQALAELDILYAVRKKYPAADQVLLTVVEKDSGDVLTGAIELLAKAAEATRNWAGALVHYDDGIKRASAIAGLGSAPLSKLQAGAVNCHEQLFRIEVQPKLNTAATLLPQGKYDEAEQALNDAARLLKGPFAALRERAAAKLRPQVQTQLLLVQQASFVAEATRLLVQSQRTLEGLGRLDLVQLDQVNNNLIKAKASLTNATKTGMPAHAHASTLQAQAQQLSARVMRSRGEYYELSQQWPQAHADYETARQSFQERNEQVAVATMQLRQSIVAMKSGKGTVVTDNATIAMAEEKVRLDMAYRAAVSFLRAGRFETASIYVPHLMGHLPEATILGEAVAQQRQLALLRETEQANTLAQDEQAPFVDLMKLYDTLPDLAKRVSVSDPAIGRQVTDLRPYVFGRLLTVGLAQGYLLQLLDLFTAQPGFLTNPELLKNTGIVCLRLATSQSLTTANYQRVVALWLTALHSSEVLLASLESTTWDDEYTFTLADSLGVRTINELPENVNQRVASESNISLGEAQRELMRAFETAVHAIENAALQTQVTAFYDQQKSALLGLVEQIDNAGTGAGAQIMATAPFTAAQFKTNQGIVNFLVARYQRDLKERILDCALPYQTTPPHPQLVGYQAALELEKKATACFVAPRKTKLQALPGVLTAGVAQLKNYPQLQTKLLAKLTNEVRAANKQEEDGLLVGTFEALVAAFPTHEPFKVMGAHHLLDWCISSVNEKRMDNATALERLLPGWKWVPDDQRLASNLCILFGNAWHEAKGLKQDKILQQLEKILTQISQHRTWALKQAINNDLLPTQQELYQMLRKNDINADSLMSAAKLGYSSQFSAEGLAMGKRLVVLQKMTALAA
jgi:tetratricopeptide (TPR) repeat protein